MEIEMVNVDCAECHITFAITAIFYRRLLKCHNTFYCPMGHGNCYSGKTEQEKLVEAKNLEICNLKSANEELARKLARKNHKKVAK